MNEEELNIRFRQILLENIPKKKTTIGRPYSVTNKQLIDAFFLCS
jgi:hypothetical protein